MPEVSVIVATFNSGDTLRCALQSIAMQDFTDFECLVIGDGCTDGSGAAVEERNDARFSWFNLPHNRGSQSFANNEGLRRARGRYIAYLGHDDLWFPWHLSGLLHEAKKSGADLTHGLCAALRPEGIGCAYGPPSQGRDYTNHHVPPSCWLHLKAAVEHTGYWKPPEHLACAVDTEMLQRMARMGKHIAFREALSVIKFPSPWWRSYRTGSPRPQPAFLAGMQENPYQLEHQLLLEMSVALARRHDPRIGSREAFREAFRFLRADLFDAYGRGRWPLAPVLSWRYRRRRRGWRRLRGLDD